MLNLLKYMQTGLDEPVAVLPDDIETTLDGLGFKTIESSTDGLETWYAKTENEYLTIQHNPTDEDISAFGIVWPSKALSLHPSPAGQYAALQWTVPANGKYRIDVTFRGASVAKPATTDLYVYYDDQQLMKFKINLDGNGNEAAYTSEHIEMETGRQISFVVGYSDQNADSDVVLADVKVSAIQQFASQSWNPVEDFNIRENPNGIWRYGYLPKTEKPQPTRFTLFEDVR